MFTQYQRRGGSTLYLCTSYTDLREGLTNSIFKDTYSLYNRREEGRRSNKGSGGGEEGRGRGYPPRKTTKNREKNKQNHNPPY
jgi:hypothetical protein